MDSTLVYVIDCTNIEATCFCAVHFEGAIVMHALAQFMQYMFFAKKEALCFFFYNPKKTKCGKTVNDVTLLRGNEWLASVS